MQVTAILATDSTGAIGAGGGLPWPRLPRDLRRFRDATMDRMCIVGRHTAETLPLLKGRRIVIASRKHRDSLVSANPVVGIAPDLTRTLASLCSMDPLASGVPETRAEVMVIGGAEVYRAAWPRLTRILLTVVDGTHPADTYLDPPGVLTEGFECLTSQRHDPDADNPLGMVFSEWVRRV